MRPLLLALIAALACSSSRPAPVRSPGDPSLQSWANGAVFYEVFVRSFQDSDGDGKGDLKGLISRLDYLNDGNPAVREEVKRIAALWLKRGVDGFRLDAARYLVEDGPGPGQSDTPATHAFWKEFAAHVRSVKPDAVLIGENWAQTDEIAPYYGDTRAVPGGDELPLNFDFPLASQLVVGVQTGDPGSLLSRYRRLIKARHASAALSRGALEPLLSSGPILAFVVTEGGERVLVVHNLGDTRQTASLSVPAAGAEPLFVDPGVELELPGGGGRFSAPPWSSGVFRLK